MKWNNLKVKCCFIVIAVFLLTACTVNEETKYVYIKEKAETSTGKKSTRSLYKENGKVYFEKTNFYMSNADGTPKFAGYFQIAFLADSEGKKIADMPYLADKDIILDAFPYEKTDNYAIDGTIVLERTTGNLSKGAKMIIEPDKSTVTFSTIDRFFMNPSDNQDLNSVLLPAYVKTLTEFTTKKGNDTKICFSDYDIDIIYDLDEKGNGIVFFPLQVFNSLRSYLYSPIVYNGYGCYYGFPAASSSSPEKNYFINESKFKDTEKSDDLKKFILNEMIFSMDTFYGLKETHNISSFKDFFDRTGLTYLLTGDATDTVQAAYDLTLKHLDDGHSKALSKYTPFLSTEANIIEPQGQTRKKLFAMRDEYSAVRKTALGELGTDYKAYEERTTDGITTAYLTFDKFSNPSTDYKSLIETYPPSDSANIDLYMGDTFGLVIYANAQIRRENSPVKNVVVDISVNAGGNFDALVYISAWLLNKKDSNYTMSVSLKNQLSGAESTVCYGADLNLDEEITSSDELPEGINAYILTSPFSFSCGNAMPAIMKNSKKVAIIGKKSGGGSCMVWPRATADGVIFSTSGPIRLSTNINGAYYDVDTGVEPDYPLNTVGSFYDRENLNKYLYKIQNPWL